MGGAACAHIINIMFIFPTQFRLADLVPIRIGENAPQTA